MANINGGSSTTVNPWSSKGMSGLASGMDTESIVQAMLQATQAKIDRQNQKLTTLEWKQSIYRDVITQMHSFQNKFFSYTNSSTNIMSSAFWNAAKVASSHSAVSVTRTGSNSNANLEIDYIKSLATAAKRTGKENVSGDIQLDLGDIAANWAKDEKGNVDTSATVDLEVSLDGVTKTIQLSLANAKTGDTLEDTLVRNLDESLSYVFGDSVNASLTGGKLAITTSEDHTLKINAKNDTAKNILGMDGSTVSNKISMNTRLGDLQLGTALQGDIFGVKINGVVIEATKDDTLSSFMSKVNKSDAGVTMSYNSLKDRFEFTSKNTGAGVNIDVEDIGGNLMNALIGAKGSNVVSSNKLESKLTDLTGTIKAGITYPVENKTFKVTINGTKKEYKIDKADTQEDLIKNLNEQIAKDYKDVSLEANADGSVVFKAGENKVEFGDAEADSLNEMLGFNKGANYFEVASDTKLSEIKGFVADANSEFKFTVDGVEKTLTADSTIDDLVKATGATFENGRLIVTGSKIADTSGNVVQNLFGTSSLEFNANEDPKFEAGLVEGTDAVLSINGQEIYRNSNTFELDGMNITLNETFNYSGTDDSTTGIGIPADKNEKISLTSTRDNEKIMSTIKDFVNDYNELIKKVRGLTSESAKELKKYPPLTEAQKKEMTDKEIELWEEKAKKGLLNHDSLLTSMESQFRGLLYKKASEDGIALYDMGITTNKDGTLKIDEDKLKATIETNIDGIEELFTSKDTGLAVQMNKMVDRFAKSSTGSPGLLVQKAGVKDTATEGQNSINRQMDDIKDFLKRLQNSYDMQKARYWKQLSSLESIVANSNSTSAWLADAFA